MTSNGESDLIGKWLLESEENFQEFLCELGVSYLLRKGSLLVKVFHILIGHEENDYWSFRVRSIFKNGDTEFKVNEELEEVTADGRSIKSIYRFEGPNRLVNEQRDKKTGKLQCICIREVNEDKEKLTETLIAGKVTATRFYSKCQ